MKIIIEVPSGKTLQQHLNKFFKARTETKLSKDEVEIIADSVRNLMKRCAVVIRDNNGNFIEGVML